MGEKIVGKSEKGEQVMNKRKITDQRSATALFMTIRAFSPTERIELDNFLEMINKLNLPPTVFEGAEIEFKTIGNPDPRLVCEITGEDGYGRLTIARGTFSIVLGSPTPGIMTESRTTIIWNIGAKGFHVALMTTYNMSEYDKRFLKGLLDQMPMLSKAMDISTLSEAKKLREQLTPSAVCAV